MADLRLQVEVADTVEVLLDEAGVEADIADLRLVEVEADIRDLVARVIREVLLDIVDHQVGVLVAATMEARLHLDQVETGIAVAALRGGDTKGHLDLEVMNPEKVDLEAHLEKAQEEDIREMMEDTSPMTEIVRVVHHGHMVILEDLAQRDNTRKRIIRSSFFMVVSDI